MSYVSRGHQSTSQRLSAQSLLSLRVITRSSNTPSPASPKDSIPGPKSRDLSLSPRKVATLRLSALIPLMIERLKLWQEETPSIKVLITKWSSTFMALPSECLLSALKSWSLITKRCSRYVSLIQTSTSKSAQLKFLRKEFSKTFYLLQIFLAKISTKRSQTSFTRRDQSNESSASMSRSSCK